MEHFKNINQQTMIEWPISRQYRYGIANDICSICYKWDTNKPELKCAECPNSFHIQCLHPRQRDYKSWSKCDELGFRDFVCQQSEVQRFQFGPRKYVNIKQEIARLKKVHFKTYRKL